MWKSNLIIRLSRSVLLSFRFGVCGDSVAITAKNKGATVVGLSVAPDIMAVIFLTSTTA